MTAALSCWAHSVQCICPLGGNRLLCAHTRGTVKSGSVFVEHHKRSSDMSACSSMCTEYMHCQPRRPRRPLPAFFCFCLCILPVAGHCARSQGSPCHNCFDCSPKSSHSKAFALPGIIQPVHSIGCLSMLLDRGPLCAYGRGLLKSTLPIATSNALVAQPAQDLCSASPWLARGAMCLIPCAFCADYHLLTCAGAALSDSCLPIATFVALVAQHTLFSASPR